MPSYPYGTVITKTQGKDFNFFQKFTVSNSTFGGDTDGYSPTCIISFTTSGVAYLLEDKTNIVEISYNGRTVHEELNPNFASSGIIYDNRIVSLIWLRLKAGSPGPAVVSIRAWSQQ